MNSGKIILGVLAGVAVGAAIGILFAPEQGAATRQKLSDKSKGYLDELEEKFNDLISSMKNKFEEAEEDISGFAEEQGRNDEDLQGQGAPGM